MRLFIGIPLNDEFKNNIIRYQKYWYQEGIRGNFTSTNNLHLTLVFLGEVEFNKVELIKRIIENRKRQTEVKSKEFKIFHNMIICECLKMRELDELYNNLCNDLKNNGFNIQNRPLYPHITIVREPSKSILNKPISLCMNTNDICLFESTRINNELIYKKL